MSNVVTWIIKAVDQFSSTYSAMNQAIATGEQKISSFNKQLNKVNDAAKSLALRVSTPIAGFGAFGIKEFLNEKKAFDSLRHTLDNLGAKAPLTFQQITDAANAIELKSIYQTDDIVNDVTHRLIRLGTIAPENLLKAQDVIVDFAAKSSMSLEAASSVFSRALQDPVAGTRFFEQRLGKLNPEIKELLKNMVETGQKAKAQALLLELAAQKVGGAAAADKLNKPFTIMTEAIARVATEFGKELLPSFQKFVLWVEKLSYQFAALSPDTKEFIATLGIIIATLPIAVIGITSFIFSLKLLGGALSFLALTPGGLLLLAIGGISAAFVYAKINGLSFSETLVAIGNGIDNITKALEKASDAFLKFLGASDTGLARGKYNFGKKYENPNVYRDIGSSPLTGQTMAFSGNNSAIDLNINLNDPGKAIQSTNLKSEGPPVNVGHNLSSGVELLSRGYK